MFFGDVWTSLWLFTILFSKTIFSGLSNCIHRSCILALMASLRMGTLLCMTICFEFCGFLCLSRLVVWGWHVCGRTCWISNLARWWLFVLWLDLLTYFRRFWSWLGEMGIRLWSLVLPLVADLSDSPGVGLSPISPSPFSLLFLYGVVWSIIIFLRRAFCCCFLLLRPLAYAFY